MIVGTITKAAFDRVYDLVIIQSPPGNSIFFYGVQAKVRSVGKVFPSGSVSMPEFEIQKKVEASQKTLNPFDRDFYIDQLKRSVLDGFCKEWKIGDWFPLDITTPLP